MTHAYEKLVGEHKDALRKEKIRRESYSYSFPGDNLCYSFQLADGSIHHMMSKVCFAGLHYFDAAVFQPTEEDEEDGDTNEYPTDDAHTVDAIIVWPYGVGVNPYWRKEGIDEYHRALAKWCELFEPILVEATLEQRLKDGIIVDMTRGSDVDCVGAFLVGFRNLHEQWYYKMFNHLTDAGLALHIAAYGTQLMSESRDSNEWVIGNTGHNTISVNPWGMLVNYIRTQKDTCKLYAQSRMITNEQHRGKLDWTLSNTFYPHGTFPWGHKDSFKKFMSPAEMSKGEGWNSYKYYHPSKALPLLVELLK